MISSPPAKAFQSLDLVSFLQFPSATLFRPISEGFYEDNGLKVLSHALPRFHFFLLTRVSSAIAERYWGEIRAV